MPRKAKELSAIAVRNLKKNGFHNVGGVTGLYLRIADSNKYWVLRFAIEGRRRDFQFAKYPETPLAEARQQAFKFRSLLNDGIDPLEWRKNKIHESILQQNQSRIANKTFKVMAEEYLQYLIDIGRYEESDRSYKLMVGRFKNHIYPAIGHILFTDVKAEHVAKILSPYRLNKPAMYKKLRYMISVIYNWARSMGYFDKEPPTNKDVLKHLLPRNCDRTVHNHPMLPIKEVPEFMNELHKKQSYSAKCLEFAILTAVRSANAREAEWSEFDFEKKEWIIPANKMKKGNENGEHVVPLSEQVIELLENIKLNQTQKCRYVFPSSKNGNSFFSDSAIKKPIMLLNKERMARYGKGYVDPNEKDSKGQPRVATPHGIARASFRTWAQDDESGNDKKFLEKVAELCLHHKVDDSYNGAYDRNHLIKSRRELMQAWADYCYSYSRSKVKNDNI